MTGFYPLAVLCSSFIRDIGTRTPAYRKRIRFNRPVQVLFSEEPSVARSRNALTEVTSIVLIKLPGMLSEVTSIVLIKLPGMLSEVTSVVLIKLQGMLSEVTSVVRDGRDVLPISLPTGYVGLTNV